MASITATRPAGVFHSLHGLLLGGTLALFLGATVGDVAYVQTYHVQWLNFASWLVVGALVFATLALLLALADLLRRPRPARGGLYAGALAVTWVLGVLGALMHAKDAWASMPEGLVFSVLATLGTCAAAWLGLARAGGRP